MSGVFSVLGYGSYRPVQSYTNNYTNTIGAGKSAASDWNKQQSSSGSSFSAAVKDLSSKLRDSANRLTSGYPPVFQQMTAAISDKDAASIKSVATGYVNAGTKSTDLNIKQVATGQTNTGSAMTAKDKDFAEGASSFSVTTGGRTYNLSVNVTSSDDNRATQQKMADAINKSGSGLTAKVTFDEKAGKSSLVVESKTGANNGFSVQDKNGGSSVAKAGADNATTQAKDAIYSINGGYDRKSASNDVSLGNGITVTLQKESAKTTVGVQRDATAAVNGVYDLVNNFNALMEAAKNNGTSGSDKLVSRLSSAAKTYSTSLARSGVTTDKNGYLKIDTDKLKESVNKGTAAGSFGSYGAGFANKVSTVAREASVNPGQYASNRVDAGSYSNNSNSYSYSSYTGLGILLNSLG